MLPVSACLLLAFFPTRFLKIYTYESFLSYSRYTTHTNDILCCERTFDSYQNVICAYLKENI